MGDGGREPCATSIVESTWRSAKPVAGRKPLGRTPEARSTVGLATATVKNHASVRSFQPTTGPILGMFGRVRREVRARQGC